MKKVCFALALAGLFLVPKSPAISLDDIQIWTGSGTNRAALVMEWSSPESLTNSSVPVPVTDKTLVWGYRFNGLAMGEQMLNAILASDRKLYVVGQPGGFIAGMGYNLKADGIIGITDGSSTNFFANGVLTNPTVNVDAAHAINGGDLYWGGTNGPVWEHWIELGGGGGFLNSPNRGTNVYWATTNYSAGVHGQWQYSQTNLSLLPLTNGSWIGFSIAAGEYESATNAAYNAHKHAPPSPDGTYAAYVCNTNDFAVQIVSASNVYTVAPYNDPSAMLGRATLKFIDHFTPHQASIVHRTKIIEPAYWTDPSSNNVLTQINAGGEVTVNMGRKIYDDPNNPYGIDLIVHGNSFFSAAGYKGSEITDFVDEGTATIPGGSKGIYGHTTIVSVSQDGTNWFTYPYVPVIFPGNAYRWDDANHCWTDEQMNETKPLNPSLSFAGGSTVANALDQYGGACGGTGYDLKASGFPWIQYVRVAAGMSLADTNAADYTVIDAIAAANPVAVGDALTITPANLGAGLTNLFFQRPDDLGKNLLAISFDSVSTNARVSTVSLNEFSAFAPVIGDVFSAYQITVKPVSGANPVNYIANVGLRAGDNYSGNGGDLRVYQWAGTNWTSLQFGFDAANNKVVIAGVTNFSAFVVSQIIPPRLEIWTCTNGFAFQFTPVVNCANVLERSADLTTWMPVCTTTPTNAQPVKMEDTNAPAGQAFYRVWLKP